MFTQERQPIFHEARLTSNSLNSARADQPEAWIGAFTSFVTTSYKSHSANKWAEYRGAGAAAVCAHAGAAGGEAQGDFAGAGAGAAVAAAGAGSRDGCVAVLHD